ncbi:M13 family metallopeptidase [Novosphingobium sp. SG720]|uniref:M13 family metallopeptidase n=1 Tax=Novosphingobium sp. SG720 TaxID=2586998 RepID=UPI0032C06815
MTLRIMVLASTAMVAALQPALAAPAARPAAAPVAKGAIGGWGVDLSGRDLSVKPGDDFDTYANGKWKARTPIPDDRPNIGTLALIDEQVQAQMKDLVAGMPADSQVGALYASFMNEAAVEQRGIAPLQADVAKVMAQPDKAAFARYMGAAQGTFGISMIDYGVGPDTANAGLNVLSLGQGGLGLPERDYYLKPAFAPQREAYVAYITRTLQTLGVPQPADAASKIMAFETQIATLSWDIARRRDRSATNNPMSSAQLAGYAPGLDWAAYFDGAGVAPQPRIIVRENTAIRDIAALYAQTPLETLKLWQAFHVADQASPFLTKAMVDSRFAFSRTLTGVAQIKPRWKRGLELVNSQLGEAAGQAYVAKYFPPQSKARMQALVANLRAAFETRIQANPWMSEPTKQAALAKLARIDVMVGYPDKWRDYSALTIKPDDLYGNVVRAARFNADYAKEDLGKPVDRKKWGMNPQTVNAYNGGAKLQIVFPAGILQPPLFDPRADDAVNYGATGAIIGHEISHSFDDQGRKIDAKGAIADWWTPQDAQRFEAEAKVFGDEYARFEAAPGAFINPKLTMGENIADLAGLQVALDAYHKSLRGKPAPVIGGLTGDQRFFLSFAQAWRANQRMDALRNQVTTDPHSPARFRILGPLPNIEAWYQAFGVKPGDAMYIPADKRAKLW